MIYANCGIGPSGMVELIKKFDPFQAKNRRNYSCFGEEWKRLWSSIECDNCYAKENLTPYKCGDHYHLVCLDCLLEGGAEEGHTIQ